MDFVRIAHALDMAIVETAEEEYKRLGAGKSPVDVAADVAQAFKSFAGLQSGTPPKYNEWDALLYLTWYQPRQINLALAAVAEYREAPQPVHIIDIGCGALVTTIAMAISAAAVDVLPSDIEVEVHGVDPSDHMRGIGLRLLRNFSLIVAREPSLSRLHVVCDRVEENLGIHRTLDEYYDLQSRASKRSKRIESTCWLTAIHAVYASNVDSLREDLKRVRRESLPVYEVVICHSIGRDVAAQICRRDAREMMLRRDNLKFHGYLDETTAWRWKLMQRLPTATDPILEPYLRRQVPWNPEQDDTAFLWRQKK